MEIKPCPFCGRKEPHLFEGSETEKKWRWVYCPGWFFDGCGTNGPHAESIEEAIAAWNNAKR